MKGEATKSNRWKWQFRLRTLFLAIGGVAVVVGLGVWLFPPSSRLYFPRGTPSELRQAVIDAYETPITEGRAIRPGWAYIGYTEPMERIASFGNDAIPVLITNIDNPRLRLQFVQLLGDLRAKEAVPILLDRLEMEDSANDVLIIAKLAEITDHPKGYAYYRGWFDEEVQREAVAEYRNWWTENGNNGK